MKTTIIVKKLFLIGLIALFSTQNLGVSAMTEALSAPSLTGLTLPSNINSLDAKQSLQVKLNTQSDIAIKRVKVQLIHSQSRALKKLKKRRLIQSTVSKATSSQDGSSEYDINLNIPRNIQAGLWNLKVVVLDKAGKKLVLNSEKLSDLNFPSQILIESNKDFLAPELISLDFPSELSVANGEIELPIKVIARDFSGIKSVTAKFATRKLKSKKTKGKKTTSKLLRKTKSIISTEASSKENKLEEHTLNIPFVPEMQLGDWFLILKLIDNNNRKTILRTKNFKRLAINSTVNLNDNPIKETTEEPEVEPQDTEEEPVEEEPTPAPPAQGGGGSPAPSGGGAPAGGGSPTPPPPTGGGNQNPPASGGNTGAPVPNGQDAPDSMLRNSASVLSGTDGSTIDNIDFIYSGSNAVQTGLDTSQLDQTRVAVVRGKVFDNNMNPLPGVKVSIHTHSEYGETTTLSNGEYNLVVNGGETFTLNYNTSGFLPIQRRAGVARRDFFVVEDVCLTPLDSQVATIDLNSSGMHMARSSMSSDVDGDREATIIFPENTDAMMVMPDGSMQGLNTLNVRATEYTVGPNGPLAMPGSLPPSSAYTYAIELSVDEAMAAGATDVQFSKPLPFYVDNYLNFPVGETVPAGYYDKQKAAWVPSDNGRVIKILGVDANGKAQVDIDGSGQAASDADLLALGIDSDEQIELALMFAIGKELWRVPIEHFTPWDCNWPYGPPPGALPPPQEPPKISNHDQPDDECTQTGSIIGCESQSLGESITLNGTPFSLEYRSNREKGYKGGKTVDIPLSDSNIPSPLKSIELEIQIAGRTIKRSFPPNPNQNFVFEWDGLDVFDREVFGNSTANISISYLYDATYYGANDSFNAAFALPNDDALNSPTRIIGVRSSQSIKLEKEYKVKLFNSNSIKQFALGGWSISEHHSYDPGSQTLFLGSGEIRSSQSIGLVMKTFADFSTNRANNLNYFTVGFSDLEIDSKGNIYALGDFDAVLLKISPDGFAQRIAGRGVGFGDTAEGILALDARLTDPQGIALDSEDNVYIAERFGRHRIRKIDENGIIRTVVGDGNGGYSGDGGPALQAQLGSPQDLTFDADDNMYIADGNGVVRKVDANGIITTIAGDVRSSNEDDNVATQTSFSQFPVALTFGPDQSLYALSSLSSKVRRISPDGLMTTFAGSRFGFAGDGGPAKLARFSGASDLDFDSNGNLYIVDRFNKRIRKVDQRGIVTTFAGTGNLIGGSTKAEDEQPLQADLISPGGLAIAKNGDIYISNGGFIRKITQGLPSFSNQNIIIPNLSGTQYFEFNSMGRHLKTFNTLTRELVYEFTYDAEDRLISITDHDGDITQIERDGNGVITAIVSPNNQRTEITTNTDGYIDTITNAVGEQFSMAYDAVGLMTSFTNPRNNQSLMTYDSLGRLTKDQNAANGSWNLARTELSNGYQVAMSSAQGRTVNHKVERLNNGDLKRTYTNKSGGISSMIDGINGIETTTKSDGTVVSKTESPDPRFGMLSPIVKNITTTLPSGLINQVSNDRLVELDDPNDPLSLKRLRENITVNGRVFSGDYVTATKTLSQSSAVGRTIVTTLNNAGQLGQRSVGGFNPINFAYDSRGRLTTITQGTGAEERQTAFTYGTNGFISKIVDPEGNNVDFNRDAIGRIIGQEESPTKQINFAFDGNANLTSITPPGKAPHSFSFTPVDLVEEYLPPNVAGTSDPSTDYSYSLDKDLTQISKPDGSSISFVHNGATGELNQITIPRGSYDLSYQVGTEQLASIVAPGNENLNFSYDGFLQVTEESSGTVNADVDVTYDNNFFVTSRSIRDANSISFAYDQDGILNQAGDLSINLNNQNSLIEGTTLDGITTSINYNSFGEPISYAASHSANNLYTVSYVRDKLGRVVSKTETIQNDTKTFDYVYDADKQLKQVSENGTLLRDYSYDANANRVQVNSQNIAQYDEQDRLTQYDGNNYSYNAVGDLVSKSNSAGLTQYNYDTLGNLIAVTLPSGQNIEYVIDGKNRRVAKKVNGALVQGLVYKDQLEPIAELDGNGNIVSRFIYATKSHVPDYMTKGGTKYRIISDNVGSVRLVVDSVTGTVAQRIDYDEFGNILNDTNPGFQPFAFAGSLYDQDTKLVRFGARDYDPEVGRWTAKDPILFRGQQTNLYVYVANDPINLVDPTGLFYIDFNVTSSILLFPTIVATGGLLVASDGVRPYAGAGIGVPGFGMSATVSEQSVSEGYNVGVQASAGLFAGFGAAQLGFDSNFQGFGEFGFGLSSPSASLTGFYVREPFSEDSGINSFFKDLIDICEKAEINE